MPALNAIALSGFTGTAPTPVESYAINNYLVNNDLLNIMPFVNIGMGVMGNMVASVVTYDKPEEAVFRKIGEEYEASNSEPKTKLITLRPLGGSYQTDRALERALGTTPGAVSNWQEQQLMQKTNAVKNAFCKYFLQGDSSDGKQFDGLTKYFGEFTSQENKTPLTLAGGMDYTNAMKVEQFLNEGISKLKDIPTCVITSRLKGKPFLQALEQHRNRGIKAIKVNDRDYYTFMGVPIVAIDDEYFPSSMTSIGTPFIFCHMAEQDGIRTAVPMVPGVGKAGAVLDIVMPRMGKNGAGQAVFVRTGAVEMLCAPVLVDPYAASLCYVKETAAAG